MPSRKSKQTWRLKPVPGAAAAVPAPVAAAATTGGLFSVSLTSSVDASSIAAGAVDFATPVSKEEVPPVLGACELRPTEKPAGLSAAITP